MPQGRQPDSSPAYHAEADIECSAVTQSHTGWSFVVRGWNSCPWEHRIHPDLFSVNYASGLICLDRGPPSAARSPLVARWSVRMAVNTRLRGRLASDGGSLSVSALVVALIWAGWGIAAAFIAARAQQRALVRPAGHGRPVAVSADNAASWAGWLWEPTAAVTRPASSSRAGPGGTGGRQPLA